MNIKGTKQAVFTIAAVLIPLVLMALAEVALRAGGGMSQRQSLFLPVPQGCRSASRCSCRSRRTSVTWR